MTVIDYLCGTLFGEAYAVVVRMEWEGPSYWTKSTMSWVWAHSRANAAAKAIRIAQRDIGLGWVRIIVESVEILVEVAREDGP